MEEEKENDGEWMLVLPSDSDDEIRDIIAINEKIQKQHRIRETISKYQAKWASTQWFVKAAAAAATTTAATSPNLFGEIRRIDPLFEVDLLYVQHRYNEAAMYCEKMLCDNIDNDNECDGNDDDDDELHGDAKVALIQLRKSRSLLIDYASRCYARIGDETRARYYTSLAVEHSTMSTTNASLMLHRYFPSQCVLSKLQAAIGFNGASLKKIGGAATVRAWWRLAEEYYERRESENNYFNLCSRLSFVLTRHMWLLERREAPLASFMTIKNKELGAKLYRRIDDIFGCGFTKIVDGWTKRSYSRVDSEDDTTVQAEEWERIYPLLEPRSSFDSIHFGTESCLGRLLHQYSLILS